MNNGIVLVAICLSFVVGAAAHDDEKILKDNAPYDLTLQVGAEAFARTHAVLDYYGVGPETDPGADFADVQGVQTQAGALKLMKYFDPHNMFSRLSGFSGTSLSVFQDIDIKSILDFSVNFKASDAAFLSSQLRLLDFNPKLPLQGLKIALDPGHMGGDLWDKLTGKYVSDDQGHIISEGVINLQTCLLLKEELQKLGASVLVTHEGLRPVSNVDHDTYDVKPYALNELRDNIHAPWFLKLISQYPAGQELYSAFDQSADRKSLFSEVRKDDYYIRRVDLWARAEVINKFKPDLVLIIHYDTDDSKTINKVNQNSPEQTKSFIVGGFEVNEVGSRAQRSYFARHLVDQKSWDLSMQLSRSIVQQMHTQLGLSLALNADTTSYPVEPGILARNLVIPRMLSAPAVAYLECLFYDNPKEFKAFLNATHPMQIDGENIPYADRTMQVAQAIRDGVIQFVSAQKR